MPHQHRGRVLRRVAGGAAHVYDRVSGMSAARDGRWLAVACDVVAPGSRGMDYVRDR